MKFLFSGKAIIIALACSAISSAAIAQSTKQRILTLEQEVSRLERTLQNGQTVQTDMLQTIQTLQKDNQELRNQLDTLQFESDRSADRQRQLYIDLDERLQGLESGRSSAAQVPTETGGAVAQDDRGAYQAAFDELKAGNYEQASAAFEAFLAAYENSELRDNAQYWLAETLYVRKDFEMALQGFQQVISAYPSSRKIPDAWLKVGYCNYELKNLQEARKALDIVIARYPESTAARLAKERITLMDASTN